jgi:hypothetical protein
VVAALPLGWAATAHPFGCRTRQRCRARLTGCDDDGHTCDADCSLSPSGCRTNGTIIKTRPSAHHSPFGSFSAQLPSVPAARASAAIAANGRFAATTARRRRLGLGRCARVGCSRCTRLLRHLRRGASGGRSCDSPAAWSRSRTPLTPSRHTPLCHVVPGKRREKFLYHAFKAARAGGRLRRPSLQEQLSQVAAPPRPSSPRLLPLRGRRLLALDPTMVTVCRSAHRRCDAGHTGCWRSASP